jgi:hypothetical protein
MMQHIVSLIQEAEMEEEGEVWQGGREEEIRAYEYAESKPN